MGQSIPLILLAAVGGWQASVLVFKLLRSLYRFYIRRPVKPQKFGSWALVTGCTDGIGLEMTKVLAQKGMNLLLVSRTESKLQTLKDELVAEYGVEASYVAIDLTNPTAANWSALQAELGAHEVGLVINNAGMSYDHPEYFHLVDAQRLLDICTINDKSLVQICHLALQQMVPRKKGCIVNVSSMVADVPTHPLTTGYVASKAFVISLSKSLNEEYVSKGIVVQAIVPAFVATKISKIRKSSFFTPSPAKYARSALRFLGYESVCYPFMPHAMQKCLVDLAPDFLVDRALMSMMLAIRKAAYKKKQKAT